MAGLFIVTGKDENDNKRVFHTMYGWLRPGDADYAEDNVFRLRTANKVLRDVLNDDVDLVNESDVSTEDLYDIKVERFNDELDCDEDDIQ